jgi:uncharacterized protein (TIGR02271 family)
MAGGQVKKLKEESSGPGIAHLNGAPVRGDDWAGEIAVQQSEGGLRPMVRLSDGRQYSFDIRQLTPEQHGYFLPLAFDELARQDSLRGDREVIPVIVDELVIDKRTVPTGAVRVNKRVDEHTETVDMPLFREEVNIRRVIINEVVDSPPPTRREGDVTIIPVVQEELVVSKRLILKEEIYLERRRIVERASQEVTLRRERAEVTRLDGEGRPVPAESEETHPRRNRGARSKGPIRRE